jgi:translocation protein SEC66
MLRGRLDEIQAQTASEKEWWEKRRSTIRSDFMKELDEGDKTSPQAQSVASNDDAVLVDVTTPSGTPAGSQKKKKGKK